MHRDILAVAPIVGLHQQKNDFSKNWVGNSGAFDLDHHFKMNSFPAQVAKKTQTGVGLNKSVSEHCSKVKIPTSLEIFWQIARQQQRKLLGQLLTLPSNTLDVKGSFELRKKLQRKQTSVLNKLIQFWS